MYSKQGVYVNWWSSPGQGQWILGFHTNNPFLDASHSRDNAEEITTPQLVGLARLVVPSYTFTLFKGILPKESYNLYTNPCRLSGILECGVVIG
jgi:hypothetical protein